VLTADRIFINKNIPHSRLNDILWELVQLCFMKKNGQHRYKCRVLGRDRSYFVKKHSDSSKEFSKTDIINMLEPSILFISMLAILFHETQLDQLPSYVIQPRVRNICVECREDKCFNARTG
jgi:hypothetical protein